MNYLMRNLLVCLVFMFSLMYGKMNCESNQVKLNSNENEREFNQKIGRLLEEASLDSDNEQNENFYYPDTPSWKMYLLKRALPRMGKRYFFEDNSEDDGLYSDEVDYNDKRALPRMGRALPRMGRALPRMGRALPRMGRTLPRMG